MKLGYYKLDESKDINSFTCGTTKDHQKLNLFLKQRALKHQNDLIGTTTVVCDLENNNEIIGYMTLISDSLCVQNKKDKKNFLKHVFLNYNYDCYPSIKIARIAVSKDCQFKDVGPSLFKLLIGIVLDLNERIGARFILVDSKNMSIDWYIKKLNFKVLDETNPNYLYYDLKGWK